ncbi:hypothetical protein BLD50_05055 [Bacillus cereus]|nr:hypothetical protein BLD50_05055 [Bacillus cereus]
MQCIENTYRSEGIRNSCIIIEKENNGLGLIGSIQHIPHPSWSDGKDEGSSYIAVDWLIGGLQCTNLIVSSSSTLTIYYYLVLYTK